MKNKVYKLIPLFILCLLLSCTTLTAFAATDKTSPSLTITPSTTEPTKGSVVVAVVAKDKSGISIVKYAKGKQVTSYFKSKGTVIKKDSKQNRSVTVKSNSTYTFYTRDKKGNEKIKLITIKNIDKEAPVINYSKNTKPTNKSVKITLSFTDNIAGVKDAKYIIGEATLDDFKTKGTSLKLTKGQSSITAKKNGTITVYATDKVGNATLNQIKIDNIDLSAPTAEVKHTVLNQVATINIAASDSGSGLKKVTYVQGTEEDLNSKEWGTNGIDITETLSFTTNSSEDYSILLEDNAGNKSIVIESIDMEMRAMWVSYLEFQNMQTKLSNGKRSAITFTKFKTEIDKMFDYCVEANMNTVVVQVRPFSDALYESEYFPWAECVSGEQGKNPGYDPMEYMIEAAHERNLEFHAWLNPYRITGDTTKISSLSEDHPARKWREDSNKTNDRDVLAYGGKLYYNPATKDAQNLIINGIKEIVENYDVDGIHFDDYFYPNLGANYKKNFDYKEYEAYAKKQKEADKSVYSISIWRRTNVSTLVKNVKKAIKAIDEDVVFGISPAGNISNLKLYNAYYVDIDTWLSSDDYVDYICPQIYWSFKHPTAAFDKVVNQWVNLRKDCNVNIYIGIANYKASENVAGDPGWKNSKTELKKQVEYGRNTKKVDGFMFFRYEHFRKSSMQTEVKNLIATLKKAK